MKQTDNLNDELIEQEGGKKNKFSGLLVVFLGLLVVFSGFAEFFIGWFSKQNQTQTNGLLMAIIGLLIFNAGKR